MENISTIVSSSQIPLDVREKTEVVRQARMAREVVFVGGLGGCGKTMLTPVVGSFKRVEIQKFNYAIEHICTLHHLGKIGDDVAVALIQMQTDLDIYNMMMSRETNFRFQDLSSVFKNPGGWRYIRRLFCAGDDAVPQRIRDEKPILHITMHDLLQRTGVLLMALGENAKIINLVRHPLYMIKQWYVNFDTLYEEKNSRQFGIWYRYRGETVPWFTLGWEEKYLGANKMDKVIYLLEQHLRHCDEVYENIPEERKSQILTIPFEPFVLSPDPYMKQIEILLGTVMTRRTYREMKRQNIPRKKIAEGIGRPIYKKYGWQPPQKGLSEQEELELRRDFAAQHATGEAMTTLDRLSAEYEKRYGF